MLLRDRRLDTLFPGSYSKITLIDNRYITSMVFKDLIEFNNQDVLFMFNTEIINNSTILRTDINNSILIQANKKNYKIFTYDLKKRKYTKQSE